MINCKDKLGSKQDSWRRHLTGFRHFECDSKLKKCFYT
jgi:hypothetical protein